LEAARAADKARAAGATLGMLHGLPIPVKDSVNTKDLPTSNGTRALRDFKAKDDAAVLKPLFAQGAILMGKTNLHELSYGWTSNNATFGPVRNPYDPEHVPGGSSGGSAAAVAARIAPLAIAEDTLGSIRVPASMCGLAGLRSTFGRYPDDGIMPLTVNKFDQVGPLARSYWPRPPSSSCSTRLQSGSVPPHHELRRAAGCSLSEHPSLPPNALLRGDIPGE
jgi:Asp-tRNA(Asn)/Glu-tRNA(Gln) amidotransferase A subunit family amidase